jgi:hypothetical protein
MYIQLKKKYTVIIKTNKKTNISYGCYQKEWDKKYSKDITRNNKNSSNRKIKTNPNKIDCGKKSTVFS